MQRLRTPDWVAGISGAVLLFSLFTPWYDAVDSGYDAWRSFGFIDLWLLLTALLAIALLVVTALKDSPAVPITLDVLTTWAGLFALLMVIYRLIAIPNDAFFVSRSWGLFVGALAVVGVFAGAWWAMRDESQPGLRPPPEVREMPVPPARDPTTPPA